MTKKLNLLITSIIGACSTIAIAITSYVEPSHITAINTCIATITAVVIELCNIFTKSEVK